MKNKNWKMLRKSIGLLLTATFLFSAYRSAAHAASLTTIIDTMKKNEETVQEAASEKPAEDASEKPSEAAPADAAAAGQEAAPAKEEKKPPVVSISDRVMIIQVDNVNHLYAKVTPENEAANYPVTWESDHPEIVSVAEDGSLAGLSPGTAHITVSISDEEGVISSDDCAICIIPNGDLNELADESENWTWKGFYRSLAHLKEYEGKPLPWDSVLCIGDSVTAGVQAGEGRLAWIPNYPLTLGYHYNIPVFNRGVGGSSIWSHGNYAIIDSLQTYEKTDAVFLMGGYNDWFYGEDCAIGDLETPGTFTYDFNALCDRIEELYGDTADIFVILPSTPHGHLGIEPYYDFSWLKAVEREVAEAHGFNLINLPADNILNGLEQDTFETFFSDYVHMNDLGYIVLGTYIADKALEIRKGNH